MANKAHRKACTPAGFLSGHGLSDMRHAPISTKEAKLGNNPLWSGGHRPSRGVDKGAGAAHFTALHHPLPKLHANKFKSHVLQHD